MHCASCGSENPEGAKFCIECAAPLRKRCPSCGAENLPRAKFCGECATPLTGEVQSPKSQVQGLEEFEARSSESRVRSLESRQDTAERRQLTVMFCDLVGSTALSAQLDPEELREVVRAYQETCTTVIRRYDGHIAQHLGDGLLVYFGYPIAHEDDAVRAVRAGLEIVTAIQTRVPSPLVGEGQGEGAASRALPVTSPHPNLPPQEGKELRRLRVRIGVHTGLVVIGEIGSSDKREILALGETPNIAARVQGQAAPDEVVISAVTYRLVEGLFDCEDRGCPALKGVSTPLTLYRVIKEGEAQSRFQVVVRKGLTPLVGREHEYGLLRERWERVKDGQGQVIMLSGEPGIGKSRLVEVLKETVEREGASCLELRCSPYSQNSALYPVIAHLQRLLHFQADETPETKLEKLQHTLSRYRFPQADTLPLLAALLSLPHPAGCPTLALSPQRQKEKTYEAIVAWLCEEARQQAVVYAWEDLHWADPSTLDLLTLFLAQVPTTRLLAVLTFRPEFTPPWGSHSYLSQLTLSRLGRTHLEIMVEKVTGGKMLPVEVVQQIVSKTDGVPLFVEELTKMVVESGLVREVEGHYELSGPLPPLAIPSTLHDSLMARLDRLATVREIAQVGATIGREFSYDLLQAVSPLDEGTLQRGLKQLLDIAQEAQDSGLLIEAYHRQGATRLWIGEFLAARTHLEQAIALYDPQQHRIHALRYGADPGVACRLIALQVLWILGYPDQALRRTQEAFTLAQEFSHVNTLGYGLSSMAYIYHARGERQAAQEWAEACVAFATEVGLPYFVAQNSIKLGSALAAQGHYEEGITKMRQRLAAQRATGGQGLQQLWLALQIEAYIETGQFEEGWTALEEALTIRPKYGERYWEADLYRLKGELTLRQSKVQGPKPPTPHPRPPTPRAKPRLVFSTRLRPHAN